LVGHAHQAHRNAQIARKPGIRRGTRRHWRGSVVKQFLYRTSSFVHHKYPEGAKEHRGE
jgi:hypothetical protein